MSTYDEEHNIRSNESAGNNNEDNEDNRQNRSRNFPTLQETLTQFLNSRSQLSSNFTSDSDFLRFNEPIQPQALEMLNEIITSSNGNGIVSFDGTNESKGVDDSFIDTLERVNIKTLHDDDACPICTNDYKSDKYPLVVELPCNSNHRFDLECISPWLKINKTCPLCRTDVTIKKNKIDYVDSEEEEEGWEMYG